MAGKYYQKVDGVKTDLVELCEPQYSNHTAAPGFGTTNSSVFKGEGPFQKAGTNTTNVTIDYKVNGTAVSTVKAGHYPQPRANCGSSLKMFNTPGEYTIVRTDDQLLIDGYSYTPSRFRCNVIPRELIICLVGAGGGAGGDAWYYSMTDGKNGRVPGGAGGGGGIIIARVDLTKCNSNTFFISVGAGGGPGTAGNKCPSSSVASNYSKGTTGTRGGATMFSVGNDMVFRATGGAGGKGSTGGPNNYSCGAGGSGGTGMIIGSASNRSAVLQSASATGGTGCSFGATGSSGISAVSFNPYSGTGSSAVQISSAKNYGSYCEEFQLLVNPDTQDFYYSGGSSFGNGAYYDASDRLCNPAGVGGGGGSGNNLSDTGCNSGANGVAYIFY